MLLEHDGPFPVTLPSTPSQPILRIRNVRLDSRNPYWRKFCGGVWRIVNFSCRLRLCPESRSGSFAPWQMILSDLLQKKHLSLGMSLVKEVYGA